MGSLLVVRLDFLYDIKAIKSDEEKELLYKTNKEFLTDSFSDGSFIQWLAIDNGRIVATSSVSFYKLPPNSTRPTGKVAYIANMFTYPAYRNQGLATKLFALSVDEAKNNGYTQISLEATEMGRPIYEKYGFKAVDNEMAYYTV